MPRGYNLRIEAGTDLTLGAGVVLLVRGGLNISGTGGPAGDGFDRSRPGSRSGRWPSSAMAPTAPRSPIWNCRAAVTRGWTARSFPARSRFTIRTACRCPTRRFATIRALTVSASSMRRAPSPTRRSRATGMTRSTSSTLTASCATAVREFADRRPEWRRPRSARLARRRRQQRVHWRRRQGGERGRGERGAVRLESCRPQHHRGGGQGSLDGLPVRQPVRGEWPRRASQYEETLFRRRPRGVRGGRSAGGDLSVEIDERSTLTRMPADAVERLNPTGMRPERVVESFSALSAASARAGDARPTRYLGLSTR